MASSGDGIDVNGGVVTLAVDAANSATLTRTAARAGHLVADWIYQGDVHHGYIDYIPAPAAPATRSNVLLPAVTPPRTGAASVTLPSDYATYRYLSLALIASARVVSEVSRVAALPTLGTNGRFSLGGSAFDGGDVLSWSNSTRTLSLPSGSTDRIVYAELHD